MTCTNLPSILQSFLCPGVDFLNDRFINLKDELKERGYKLTSQRQAVLDIIQQYAYEHLSTEEVYERVKKEYPDIGLATVYRTLLLLEQMELIYRIDLDDGLKRYELIKNKEDHRHHHLICTRCGSVDEVKEDLLDALETQILRTNGFVVKDHRVKFYGYCKKCMEKAD